MEVKIGGIMSGFILGLLNLSGIMERLTQLYNANPKMFAVIITLILSAPAIMGFIAFAISLIVMVKKGEFNDRDYWLK